ncbi:DUF3019 domain-containing protein [Psychrosphaera sp. F3M07]|nr:DUF3019 domain-containing protein [Psychrosphaera sp. F3M07]
MLFFKMITSFHSFGLIRRILFVLSTLCCVNSYAAEQQTTEDIFFKLKPHKCVSLHEGQQCFTKVKINWQTNIKSDYCLYSSQQRSALYCWKNTQQGNIEHELNTNADVQFVLKQSPNIVISESILKVSWVYKKKQKSRLSWRLF